MYSVIIRVKIPRIHKAEQAKTPLHSHISRDGAFDWESREKINVKGKSFCGEIIERGRKTKGPDK